LTTKPVVVALIIKVNNASPNTCKRITSYT